MRTCKWLALKHFTIGTHCPSEERKAKDSTRMLISLEAIVISTPASYVHLSSSSLSLCIPPRCARHVFDNYALDSRGGIQHSLQLLDSEGLANELMDPHILALCMHHLRGKRTITLECFDAPTVLLKADQPSCRSSSSR